MNEARLRKGAQMLGALWKKGERCTWVNDCYCATPNNFCKAKELFIKLALEAGVDKIFPDEVREVVSARLPGMMKAISNRQIA